MPQDITLTLSDEEVAACQLASDERAASGIVGVLVPTVEAYASEKAHAALTSDVTHYHQVKQAVVLTAVAGLKSSDLTTVAATLKVSEADLAAAKV